jgi:hypothetical protein
MREASDGCTQVVVCGTVAAVGVARIKGYQLWIALPPEEPDTSMLGVSGKTGRCALS